MYAKYVDKRKIDLHYCCFDMDLPKIVEPKITIKYISLSKNRLKSYLLYFYESKKYIQNEKFDLIFHIDSKFTLTIRLINLFNRMVFDIRSGDLSNNSCKLRIKNLKITISSWFYKHTSIISESLSKELKLNPRKTIVIPLGGEYQSFKQKKFDTINLLYVGSLNNRNIEQTIMGYCKFKLKYPNIEIIYDIIGFGSESTENLINQTIIQNKLQNYITFHGRKTLTEVAIFLDKCNVGVVYIPQKKYYDFQPATKLFESVLAGMPVIATNTTENRLALKKNCGVICEDNPESFSKALEKILEERETFNSENIKKAYSEYNWKFIVENIWTPYILNT